MGSRSKNGVNINQPSAHQVTRHVSNGEPVVDTKYMKFFRAKYKRPTVRRRPRCSSQAYQTLREDRICCNRRRQGSYGGKVGPSAECAPIHSGGVTSCFLCEVLVSFGDCKIPSDKNETLIPLFSPLSLFNLSLISVIFSSIANPCRRFRRGGRRREDLRVRISFPPP